MLVFLFEKMVLHFLMDWLYFGEFVPRSELNISKPQHMFGLIDCIWLHLCKNVSVVCLHLGLCLF